MIVYDLSCDNQHTFEGWFASADAFQGQRTGGLLSCPICASAVIERLPPAPYVNTGAREAKVRETVSALTPALMEQLRRRFVEYVLEHSEDVGQRFPEEARRIFQQAVPERAIRGQASPQEVAELREEGIDVLALPDLGVPPERTH